MNYVVISNLLKELKLLKKYQFEVPLFKCPKELNTLQTSLLKKSIVNDFEVSHVCVCIISQLAETTS